MEVKIKMANNLEENIRAVEAAIECLNTIDDCDKITEYGVRLLECIRSKDYQEAGFVWGCQLSAFTISAPKIGTKTHEKEYSEEVRKNFHDYLRRYISSVRILLASLPQDDIARGRREFDSD